MHLIFMSSLAKMRKSPPSILPQRVPGIHLKEVRTRDSAKRFMDHKTSLAKMRKSPPSILPQRVPGIHLKEVRTRDSAKRFFYAMDYFKLYFTLDIVTHISQYTNDYAKIHGPQKIPIFCLIGVCTLFKKKIFFFFFLLNSFF
ncbi:hypothetical protein Btru_071944 [Bulinus truncatus]|nr:hypothetical protein Btru_071944 [Bulinus truncatus]